MLAALLTAVALAVAIPAPAPVPTVGYVDVAVATVWTAPTSPRPVDARAVANPVDVRGWLAGMTPAQQQGLTDGNLTQTQALYGQRVVITGSRDGWYRVAVPGQPNPKNAAGYPGWIPRNQVSTAPLPDGRAAALVDRATTTWLYDDAHLTRRSLEISINTRLPLLGRTPTALQVRTPDGPRWLSAAAAGVVGTDRAVPRPTGADLVRFATLFVGTPYLWAGRSGFGVDCSGFTSMIYQANGITIPRDSGPQAAGPGARRVARADLRPGDLLFYAHDHGRGAIHHVAMYVGDGRMIEAYDHSTPVRLTPARFDSEYRGAVRYL